MGKGRDFNPTIYLRSHNFGFSGFTGAAQS